MGKRRRISERGPGKKEGKIDKRRRISERGPRNEQRKIDKRRRKSESGSRESAGEIDKRRRISEGKKWRKLAKNGEYRRAVHWREYTVRALANLYLNFSKYISETMSKISISFEAEREGNVYRLVEKS